MEPLNYRR